MTIYAVYVINKAGSLIYHKDSSSVSRPAVEKTFSYPLELVLKVFDEKIVVSFGERDGIKVGHAVLSINGIPAEGRSLQDGRDILGVLANENDYPINIKFGRPNLQTNERIMLASMLHSLFAIGSQLSPVPQSSGIQIMETDTFKLHCHQTMTGVKFVIITDPKQVQVKNVLNELYEAYADFALKNPFYSLDMPIRCELFDRQLEAIMDRADRPGINNV